MEMIHWIYYHITQQLTKVNQVGGTHALRFVLCQVVHAIPRCLDWEDKEGNHLMQGSRFVRAPG